MTIKMTKRELSPEEQIKVLAEQATRYSDLVEALRREAYKYGFAFADGTHSPTGNWYFKDMRPGSRGTSIEGKYTMSEAVELIFKLARTNGPVNE